MATLIKLLLVVATNGVVLWGVGFDQWTGATALVLYWCENLITVVLVALRIALHRGLTGKAGHYRPQMGVTAASSGGTKPITFKSFLTEFLVGGFIFTIGHGVFVIAILGMILKTSPDETAIRYGLFWIALFKLVDLLIDTIGISRRPFAWIKQVAGLAFGRIVLLHLAIIGGVGLAALSGRNEYVVLPLACLKLLVEVLGAFHHGEQKRYIPRWLIRTVDWFKRGEGAKLESYLQREMEREDARDASDEIVRK